MVKVVIFDFDGVIADSLPVVDKAAKKVFHRLKYPFPAINRDDDLKKILMEEMKLNAFQQLRLIKAMRKEVAILKDDLQLFQGMRELFEEIIKDRKVMILSSNAYETIEALLRKHHFPEIEIISDSSLFGKDKVLKRVLKNHYLSPQDVVYVGDEVRDVEACKKIGVQIFAVSWGYNSEKSLIKAGATQIIRSPEEITKLLN
jgi:HAD superfamily hydrolase (TIGR01549 family)